MYPSPGTCNISLTKTRRTSWTLILDPLEAIIETIFPERDSGKDVLSPSINLSMLSKTSKVPKDHPVNLSVNILSIVTLNSWNEEVVGIPDWPPNGIVKTSPTLYPYPVFFISKSIILDPCPTTTSTVALVPIPDDGLESLKISGIFSYERGSSKMTIGGLV